MFPVRPHLKKPVFIPLFALVALTALGCASDQAATSAPERTKGQQQVAAPSAARSGIDKGNFNTAVRAQDDFFRHTNGTWLKKQAIPADRSNYGAFTELVDKSEASLKVIIDEAAGMNAESGTTAQRVGDAYKSFMDVAKADALGFDPVKKTLERIDGIEDHTDVASALGMLSGLGVKTPYGYWIDQDAKDPSAYILYFQQSGLSLPDRDYYLIESETNTAAQAAMTDYIKTVFAAAGASAAKQAEAVTMIMGLEKEIATIQWKRADTRDREKAYNKVTAAEAPNAFGGFPVNSFFEGMGVPMTHDVIVRQPTFVSAMGELFKKTPAATWQAYLMLHTLDRFAPYLASSFVDAHFSFHSKALAGVKENRTREKRGIAFVEQVLGEDVGRLYVERHFTPEAKARMAQLVKNLIVAFEQRIETRPWMSAATKVAAKEKLSKFTTKIGYPNKWKDYGLLTMKTDDLMGNVVRSATLEHKREMSKLGKPVDREEWFMTPQTVNAYYNSNMNEIVFPAAILQPPFFDMEADDAANYGGIGAVIGHELSHGFDDQGAKSDGDGNLRNWWQPEDEKKFKAKGAALVSQYAAFAPFPDANVNGELTLGENIGDLGGITVAHAAYQLSLGGKPAPVIDDMTGPQRFFYGWGQIWRRKYRDAELRRRLLTDPHSPSEYRVVGVLRNVPAFYEAFGVKAGDKMFMPAAERVEIW